MKRLQTKGENINNVHIHDVCVTVCDSKPKPKYTLIQEVNALLYSVVTL